MDSFLSIIGHENHQVVKEGLGHALRSLGKIARPEDYILLPLLAIGSAYIYNAGSVFPKGKDAFHHKMFERPQESIGVNREASTRNVAEKLQETGADLVIFWGSQSGVAEGFANRLARELKHSFKLNPLVADLSDYNSDTIAQIPQTKFAVFIMSTFGEGDPSDNAVDFVNWVSSKMAARLENIRYAAFGCGNKNYRFYNKVIDDVTGAMDKLGAVALLPTGRGDEAARTTEEDFSEWREKLFAVLQDHLHLQMYDVGYEAGVDVVPDESGDASQMHLSDPMVRSAAMNAAIRKSPVITAPITVRKEIASYSEKKRGCAHIEIDLSAYPQVKYRTGDHLAVWPVNPAEDVRTLLDLLGLQPQKDKAIRIVTRVGNDETKVPSPSTAEALLKYHLEICAPVPRETLYFLGEFAPTQKVKEELVRIAKDKQTYATFLEQNYLTLPRLLSYTIAFDPAASWTSLPLSFVIDVLPAMKPRTYSIASSPVVAPRQVHLAVSVKPTELIRQPDACIPGLASTFLSQVPTLQSGMGMDTSTANQSMIHMQVRSSTFKLPVSLNVPVIMVAAGTGIAPFRAFIHDRSHVATVGRQVGPMMLFFGCQNQGDYLYEDELVALQKGSLAGKLELNPAFSRTERNKQYVTDAVEARSTEIGRLLIEEDAAFYICGAAAMAKSVRDVVREAIKATKGWSDYQAEDWRLQRKKVNRWFEDVWS